MPSPNSPLDLAPAALLLDFGGVVFETRKLPDGRDRVAAELTVRLERAGVPVPIAELRAALEAALTALTHWKHASSRRLEPRELGHREIVGDFLASDLPPAARGVLVAEASEVLEFMNTALSEHRVRPGIRELLAEADRRGIPVGIVSNAHSGRSHRRLIAEHGLEGAFAVQLYSDEVGMRKPHPRMIELAAAALGAEPAECWYVGDTQDRDVVAGRRAGVAAAIVTRGRHTDHPPFAVADRADAEFETPEGLFEALHAAAPRDRARPRPVAAARLAARPALLIDHGGVISLTEPGGIALQQFAGHLAALLSTADDPMDADAARELVARAKGRYSALKAEWRADFEQRGARLREITPHEFWVELVGAELSPRRRALLEAEAHDLTYRYGLAKSHRRLRSGIGELLAACHAAGWASVVVSNTINGRAVRAECRRHGLDEVIGAYVCSDEIGIRKPDPAIAVAALELAHADPALSWFVGDKPANDALAAQAAGIPNRVLLRSGSTPDAELDAALAAGLATAVVDDGHGVLSLLGLSATAAHATRAAAR